MAGKRRRFSPQEKMKILREHFLDSVSVSDVCDKHGINPSQFYRWQKDFFENGAVTFERKEEARVRRLEEELKAARAKLAQKDGVIAEIMQSHVELKKKLGES